MTARVVVEYNGTPLSHYRDSQVAVAAYECGLGDCVSSGYSVAAGIRDLAYLALSREVAEQAIECMRGKLPWADLSIALDV